jgi:hypothetical protein
LIGLPLFRPSIRQGRIVYAWISDRNGHTKLRPAIVMTPDDEIGSAAALVVMAITTTFSEPPPWECVPLPWHPRKHPVTHLHKRSAAVVSWLSSLRDEGIIGYGGDVPQRTCN